MTGGGDDNTVQPTADQVASQQINANLWNYYVTNYKPLVDKYASNVENPETQSEQAGQVAGEVSGSFMGNMNPANASTNPVANEMKGLQVAQAGTTAQIQGQGGVKAQQLESQQNVIDIGRGQETTAQAGMGDIASQSVQSAIATSNIGLQEQAAEENAFGSVAGAIAGGLIKAKPWATPGGGAYPAGTGGGTSGPIYGPYSIYSDFGSLGPQTMFS